jgi:RNA polymerase sigma-70 factor (ECF subfamily)
VGTTGKAITMSGKQEARVYDELLVLMTKQGDRAAGERLAARWAPRLLRTARRLLGNEDQAADAAQEAWAAITKGLPGLREPARFPAWAYGIVHRKCADRIRSEQRRRAVTGEESEGSTKNESESGLAIAQAFQALSPDQRSAATLFFSEGLSLIEIAAAMDVPVGTVKSRLFHARRTLKALLSEGE